YERVLAALEGDAESAAALRRELAVRVFARTSAYDAAIAGYLSGRAAAPAAAEAAAPELVEALTLTLERVQPLRYGENPDQPAAFYRDRTAMGGLPDVRQLHGKELSFINLLDADAASFAVSA